MVLRCQLQRSHDRSIICDNDVRRQPYKLRKMRFYINSRLPPTNRYSMRTSPCSNPTPRSRRLSAKRLTRLIASGSFSARANQHADPPHLTWLRVHQPCGRSTDSAEKLTPSHACSPNSAPGSLSPYSGRLKRTSSRSGDDPRRSGSLATGAEASATFGMVRPCCRSGSDHRRLQSDPAPPQQGRTRWLGLSQLIALPSPSLCLDRDPESPRVSARWRATLDCSRVHRADSRSCKASGAPRHPPCRSLRTTILSASSHGSGRCSALASPHGARHSTSPARRQDGRHHLRVDRLDPCSFRHSGEGTCCQQAPQSFGALVRRESPEHRPPRDGRLSSASSAPTSSAAISRE